VQNLTLTLTLTLTSQDRRRLTSPPGAPAPREATPFAQQLRVPSRAAPSRARRAPDLHRAVVRGLASHLEPTRRRRAHVQASALAGEEARGGAIASAAVARRKEERLRGAKVNGLGFRATRSPGGFDPPKSTRDRRLRLDGRGRSAGVRASYGPGGTPLSWPRPRLRPGARVSALRARLPRWAGPVLGRSGPKKQ
jgi:hypothetical protein